MYRALILSFLIALFAGKAGAQATDTVINQYAAVISYNPCTNEIVVDTASGFAAGDDIVLIQMKGIEADTTNTATFGQVQNWHHAGNYEINNIQAVNGNAILLTHTLAGSYDIPTGKVQIVRIPHYNVYTVDKVHTAAAWGGTKGGVFAIWANDSLILNADINVSGKGFRGGLNNSNTPHNQSMLNQPDYCYQVNPYKGAAKGEGVLEVSPSSSYCRGPLYNGGGGGNSINSGGGGGSNAGTGGRGGNEWAGALPPNNVYGGLGGYPFSYTPANNRVFMGGGGGAGEANDGFITKGGDGGGIVIILADKLLGKNNSILANGEQGIDCPAIYCNDGFGGGGGGGAILINAQFTDQLNCYAQGGRGANLAMSAGHGPGGGGGGGAVLVNNTAVLSALTYDCTGGVAGQYINGLAVSNWGAQNGGNGIAADGFTIPVATASFLPVSVAIDDSIVACRQVWLSAISAKPIIAYDWAFGDNTFGTGNPASHTYSSPGNYLAILTVTLPDNCTDTFHHLVSIQPQFNYAITDSLINCRTAILTANNNGGVPASDLVWLYDAGKISVSNPATLVFDHSGTHIVQLILTDSIGCADTIDYTLNLDEYAINLTTSNDTIICPGEKIGVWVSGAQSYSWSPSIGIDNPHSATPVVNPVGPIIYYVNATDENRCMGIDSVTISVLPVPNITITASEDELTCDKLFLQLFATGAINYQWSPAEYFNDPSVSSPIVTPGLEAASVVVKGTGANGCTGTAAYDIPFTQTIKVFVPDAFTPNGDLVNDHIRTYPVCNFTFSNFSIYNRWGQRVFYSEHEEEGWDGRFNGLPEQVGVYYYYIRGRKNNGESALVKGDITLIR